MQKKEKLFGTDGIRGIPGQYPLTDGMVYKIGDSLCRYLYYKNRESQDIGVVIAKDTRISGSRIEKILTNAFISLGIDVYLAGIIPTPALAYLVDTTEAKLGIMISASHNKPGDNGMKFFTFGARKISLQDEEWIEDIVFGNLIKVSDGIGFGRKGKITRLKDEILEYEKFLNKSIEGIDISKLKVCLDSNWGATSGLAKDIFKNTKAKIHSINDSPLGEGINNSSFTNYSQLKREVIETVSDVGFAFDGDGDRVIAIDEQANTLDGDEILAIIAKYYLDKGKLPNNSIAATSLSNIGFRRSLKELGIEVIVTPVGDKNVLKAMIDNGLNLGGEPTGQVILLDYLPTPDGMLTALELLKVIKESGLSLSRLSKIIKKVPQVLINIPVREKIDFENIASVSEKVKQFNAQLKGEGRIFLRYSHTENIARLKVEAKTEIVASAIANCIALLINKEIGLEAQDTFV